MSKITKAILSVALLSMLVAPASARIECDEGGLSAYARFGAHEGPQTLVNRPGR